MNQARKSKKMMCSMNKNIHAEYKFRFILILSTWFNIIDAMLACISFDLHLYLNLLPDVDPSDNSTPIWEIDFNLDFETVANHETHHYFHQFASALQNMKSVEATCHIPEWHWWLQQFVHSGHHTEWGNPYHDTSPDIYFQTSFTSFTAAKALSDHH